MYFKKNATCVSRYPFAHSTTARLVGMRNIRDYKTQGTALAGECRCLRSDKRVTIAGL
ncbi:MAG: hypothetical protein LBS04_06465 [Tannerellaceae bacterium]|jgi:hypothetical protein|nr:hypothetical protein [Tannerellaceae bacterium]